MLSIPGISELNHKLTEVMRKNPEIIPSHKYFEMTREEQMEHDWKRIKREVEIDPKLFMSDAFAVQYYHPEHT
jgi:hypothetical protein